MDTRLRTAPSRASRPSGLWHRLLLLSLFSLPAQAAFRERAPEGYIGRDEWHAQLTGRSSGINSPGFSPVLSGPNSLSAGMPLLEKRDALLCGPGAPCVDDSCCGKDGKCGYGPDYCGAGCMSNCNATAMCGEFSEDADVACGLSLCCSAMGWCGTTAVHCLNADPLHNTLPCQAGYGSCQIIDPPSCSPDGGSTGGRTVGYYQSWNVRDRKCNTVSPKQIKTEGFTHLFFAFATINPVTFKIAPAHPDDAALMREFTGLSKGGKLQTWIAIGGFDFSNEGTPTHTTWSDMCSTAANRAAFIKSVISFMDEYGFQGADLDWEYPAAPSRGGKRADTQNFVMLVKEMRAAFGTKYGISLPLAPDYWYLRGFNPSAMERYVDFFGFMAYDLHGPWDSDVGTLGSIVRGQADIRDIERDTLPLWFDGLNPAKINFGLAMYGRGYTLSDPSCNRMLDCKFSGPSSPAACTNFGGVMSLSEVKRTIKEKGLTPRYNKDALMKELTWDDQWIGYDDEETYAAKKRWANGQCFGGTMYWSVDFQLDDGAYYPNGTVTGRPGTNGTVTSTAPAAGGGGDVTTTTRAAGGGGDVTTTTRAAGGGGDVTTSTRPVASGTPTKNTPGASGTPTQNTPGASGTPTKNTPGPSGTPTNNTPGASGTPTKNTPGPSGTPTNNTPGASGTPTNNTPGPSGTPTNNTPGVSGTPTNIQPGASGTPTARANKRRVLDTKSESNNARDAKVMPGLALPGVVMVLALALHFI